MRHEMKEHDAGNGEDSSPQPSACAGRSLERLAAEAIRLAHVAAAIHLSERAANLFTHTAAGRDEP